MNTLTFLLSTVIELYTMVLLLRIWMQWAHCDFYNPFSQFVVKVTQPIIGPLRRVIPAMGPIDSASLLVAYILSFIKAIVLFKVVTFLPIIWIAGLLILLKTIGLLIFWVLLVMAIMSWVSQGNSHLVKFLGKQFRVAKSQVVIEKGELGRHKQIKIINPQQIPPEIAALIN